MKDIPLGRNIQTPVHYDPSILFPIPRKERSCRIYGLDVWRAYELSWLDRTGKPVVGVMELVYPVESRNLVESKSLKLYLHGISNTPFSCAQELAALIRSDLMKVLVSPWVEATLLGQESAARLDWRQALPGICIDELDIGPRPVGPDPAILALSEDEGLVKETLHSHVLRTYCPITRQPDWADVLIDYQGKGIDHTSVLRYLCAYRDHEGFSEECCEKIFTDILMQCAPGRLKVGCFYTRRGGIDINPVRTSYEITPQDSKRYRLFRQ